MASSYSIGPNYSFEVEGNSESTTHTFTITRTGSTEAGSSVDWSVAPSEWEPTTDGADFVGGALPSGTVTFAPGETSQTFTVSVAGDTQIEYDELFTVTLSPVGGGTVDEGVAYAIVVSDDLPLHYSIGPSPAFVTEGDAGSNTVTFTIERNGTTAGPSTVDWAVINAGQPDSADAADFVGGVLPGGTVTFAPWETSRTITVSVAGDTVTEAPERFSVSISNVGEGAVIDLPSAQGYIVNDDTAVSRYSVGPSSLAVWESEWGSSEVTFTVTRNGFTAGTSSVDWAVTGDGSAPVAGSDFADGSLPSGTVVFAPGETVRTITLVVAEDSVIEADEGFLVTLTNPSDGFIGTASAQGRINEDNVEFAIAAADADNPEGNSGTTPFTFTITRNGASSGYVSAQWSVTSQLPNAGADFEGGLSDGWITFLPGETSQTLTINVLGDTAVEADESFTVNLSTYWGTVTTATATGVIRNDDGGAAQRSATPTPGPNFGGFDTAAAAFGLGNPADGGTGFAFTTTGGTFAFAMDSSEAPPLAPADTPAPWLRSDGSFAILA